MVSLFKHSFVLISMQLLVHAADFKEHEFILQKWNSFKIQFNKRYESAEEDRFRMKIFLTNEDEIAKHNERFEKGEVSYEKEMTKFGDLTPEEFAQLYSTDADPISIPSPHIVTSLPPILGDPPESKNWVAEGAVTSVKNQGSCDSCWAFAAAGAIESHYFIKYGKLIPLSAQNLMDCVGNTEKSNNDCCGGQMRSAFDYVKNRGIATEEVYPYTDKESICEKKVSENEKITIKNIGRPYPFQNWVKINKRECKISLSKSSTFTIKNYTRLLHKNEEELKRIVGLTGPVTASINSHGLFEYYEQGMIWNDDYCTNELGKNDHGVLIVGYGTDAGEDYWLVKNSWGVDWGDKGYFRIARGPYNTCGIANYNYYPII